MIEAAESALIVGVASNPEARPIAAPHRHAAT
jgi:hypothetical protein